MTALYVIFGVILLVVLLFYAILAVATYRNLSEIINTASGEMTFLSELSKQKFVRTIKREAKTMLKDQSILMVTAAVIFYILPLGSFYWVSYVCVLFAISKFFHCKFIDL